MVAKPPPIEGGVGSRKGRECKETDSLGREKEGWCREREGKLRQAKQQQKYYRVDQSSVSIHSPPSIPKLTHRQYSLPLQQRSRTYLPLTCESRHHRQTKWLKCT